MENEKMMERLQAAIEVLLGVGARVEKDMYVGIRFLGQPEGMGKYVSCHWGVIEGELQLSTKARSLDLGEALHYLDELKLGVEILGKLAGQQRVKYCSLTQGLCPKKGECPQEAYGELEVQYIEAMKTDCPIPTE